MQTSFIIAWRWYLRTALITIAFFGIALGALDIALAASPAEDAGIRQTVPPLVPLTMQAMPKVVDANQILEFEIQFANTSLVTYTGATVGITVSMPVQISAFGEISATQGNVVRVNSQEITWTGVLNYQDQVSIRYRARLEPGIVTSTLTSTATLWERLGPTTWPTATNRVLTTTATVQVLGYWPAYMPMIVGPTPTPVPLAPLPVLGNWDFEQGRNGDWSERSGSGPSQIIYAKTESDLILPPFDGKSNEHYAWLGGEFNITNVLSQAVPIPAGYTQIKLVFDAWVQSADTCGFDSGTVRVADSLVLQQELCVQKNSVVRPGTGGWTTQSLALPNLADIVGKKVDVVFSASTNGTKNSNWYIDNVRFCSTDPAAAPQNQCK
jgi:hypothetical protein